MANLVAGATAPLVLVSGLAAAGWITIWAIYPWAERDVTFIVAYSGATFLALALPVAFLVLYERWQVKHEVYDAAGAWPTRALGWACGLLAALLAVVVLPIVLVSVYFAWMFWQDGLPAASVYFVAVALAASAVPVAFLFHYDRWRARNGLA